MKNVVILFVVLMSAPLSQKAQDIIFKANLAALGFGSYSPSIEVPLANKFSFHFGAGYVVPQNRKHNTVKGATDEYSIDAFYRGPNLTAELRFFPFENKKAPYGFYISGYFRYMMYQMKLNFNYSDDLGKQTATGNGSAEGYGGGATIGYQVKIGKVFVIDAFAGGGVIRTAASGFFPGYGQDMDKYTTIAEELDEAGNGLLKFRAGADPFYSFFFFKGGLPMIRAGFCIGIGFKGMKSVPLDFD